MQVPEAKGNGTRPELTAIDWAGSTETRLFIPRTLDKETLQIKVGQPLADTKQTLPRPSASYTSVKRPPYLGEAFTIWGWETERESVGVVGFQDRTALVTIIYDDVEPGYFDDLHDLLAEDFGEPTTTISGDSARYQFWEEGSDRLMVCMAKSGEKTWVASISLGQLEVMNHLDMSTDAARRDVREADDNWKRRASATPAPSASSK